MKCKEDGGECGIGGYCDSCTAGTEQASALPDLLPCPFCGGQVRLEQTVDRRKWWGVACRNAINRGGSCAIQILPSASKEAAVARWNMRDGKAR